jgi:hypothetical protein
LAEAGASSFSVPLDESFADENKDAGGQRYNVEQENGWPDIRVCRRLNFDFLFVKDSCYLCHYLRLHSTFDVRR